jgi:hypothetical protein
MTAVADRLSQTMRQHRQQACLVQRLDDEPGLHHGLSWSDLLLLDALHDAGGPMSARQAAVTMGRSPAGLLLQVLAAGGARRLRDACDTARTLLATPSAPSGQAWAR